MVRFLLRRLVQSALTIFGVMVLTFLLFRVVAGDIAAAHLGDHATEQQKAEWRHAHGYDRPGLVNYHRRLTLIDRTGGAEPTTIEDVGRSRAADRLALIPAPEQAGTRVGRYVAWLGRNTPIEELTGGKPLLESPRPAPPTTAPASAGGPGATSAPGASAGAETSPPAPDAEPEEKPGLSISLADGTRLVVDLSGVKTCGDLLDRINSHPAGRDPATGAPRVEAGISRWSPADLFDSQFFDHLHKSVTFDARSLNYNQKLTSIIVERAPRSLALMVPAMALEWLLGMVVSCLVAYYRGRLIDKVGVFLSVLGMCVPFLAFMIYGQWLMFEIAPGHAYGLTYRVNIFVPVAIMVVAGLGGMVRFYRTVILDEVNRDYVRTAMAKGVPLPGILFKHVLRNCMLPILTNLVLSLPFLIMGSLLVETYFGIPGLGDLLLGSINDLDEPILSGMVFLMALIYTVGVLLTDLSYAVFDPRIRLR